MKKPLFALALVLWSVACLHAQGTPVISEFMASNLTAILDDDDDASDWIEIYNPSGTTYALGGHFLTDDRRNLRKWMIPSNLNVPANGYALVFASGKDRSGIFATTYHSNFELSTDGDYLALVASDGETILSEFAERYPKQRTGLSYGIRNNESGGNTLGYFETPTPKAANGEGRDDLPPQVADTKFSVGRGFFTEPFTVEITTATEDALIYYSTDGSDPGPGSVFQPGKQYTEPVAIEGTTILRARAYKEGLEPTNIDTHTYLFIADVLQQSDDQPGLPDRWNGQRADYGMSPDIVESPDYQDRIHDAFVALPTLSIVTDSDHLWASDGLYLNTTRRPASGEGADFAYEFEVSAELIHPDGKDGFQVHAGLRAQGGASRNADRSSKHALSLRFRRVYGTGRLDYPVIPSSPVQSYNSLHLRARYNNSWIHSNSGQRDRAQYIRDQWARDSMIEMGTPSAGHGDYAHLYLNGLYWGIYVMQERLDSSHYASYYGGRDDEIDAVNGGRATDGDLNAYNAMRAIARAKDWEGLQSTLDVDNYIDWHIIQRFASNRDWKNDGNWKAAGGGPDNRPWRFYAWDTERILEGLREGVPGPSSDPSMIFNSLDDMPEFVRRFGDRLHKHLFNSGALTPERNVARYQRRAMELDVAIIAESARWGDNRRGTPYERDDEWVAERDRILNDYFPERTAEVIDQYQDAGLYPKTLGVDLNQFGGRVPTGFELTLSSKGTSVFNPGKIYYTTDGSDPIGLNDAVSAAATEYATPIALTESLTFKARVRSTSGEWSALTETFFAVDTNTPSAETVTVSEIMYHPGPPTAEESAAGHVSSDDFEFIELHNVSDSTLDLAGSRFDRGIDFHFLPGHDAILAPGATLLLVRDAAAFRYRYGDTIPVHGVYSGALANGGETLQLTGEDGNAIHAIDYSDRGNWPRTADGEGFSMVLQGADPDKATSWQASVVYGGSPGQIEDVDTPQVVIHEILTNSEPPAVDAVELHNLGSEPIDVSGWFLTDDPNTPSKYAIAAGTLIAPGGYLVIEEDNDSNPDNNADLPANYFGQAFGLSSRGDAIHLFAASDGNLSGYSDGFSFGAAAQGVTFGRVTDSQGRVAYPPLAVPTLGSANAAPAIGPIVFSEIMYHSDKSLGEMTDAGEYVELANRSETSILLDGWEIDGLGFAFPSEITIAPGEAILITRLAAADFRTLYTVPETVQILGPAGGRLDNDGERLTLTRPGETYTTEAGAERTTQVIVDSVRYNDASPWPESADGMGRSLERTALDAYGDEVGNWAAGNEAQGTPGIIGNAAPTEDGFTDWVSTYFTEDERANPGITGPASDPDADALPNLVEYALGTDPSVSQPSPLTVHADADGFMVHYPMNSAATDLRLRPEISDDLQSWQDATALGTPIDAAPHSGWRFPLALGGRYLRIHIER